MGDDRKALEALHAQLGKVILGKDEALTSLTVALLAGGHILMEDVPGVGKTTLSKALAKSLTADFRRVQFTPDLLPTDILGSSVYHPREGTFTFKPGPICVYRGAYAGLPADGREMAALLSRTGY